MCTWDGVYGDVWSGAFIGLSEASPAGVFNAPSGRGVVKNDRPPCRPRYILCICSKETSLNI